MRSPPRPKDVAYGALIAKLHDLMLRGYAQALANCFGMKPVGSSVGLGGGTTPLMDMLGRVPEDFCQTWLIFCSEAWLSGIVSCISGSTCTGHAL